MSRSGGLSTERVPSLLSLWSALSVKQRWIAVAAVAGFFLLPLLLGWERRANRMEIIRQQFHLPPDIAFSQFEPGSSKLRSPAISGIVQFTDQQYRQYAAALHDSRVWRPTPLNYRGIGFINPYAPDALRWQDAAPHRRYGGDPLGRWGSSSEEQVHAMTKGRYLCFAVLKIDSTASGGDAGLQHKAVSCRQLQRTDEAVAVVKGALDDNGKTLHMLIY